MRQPKPKGSDTLNPHGDGWDLDYGLADINETEDPFAMDGFAYAGAEDKAGNVTDKDGRPVPVDLTPYQSQKADHRDEGGRAESPVKENVLKTWPLPSDMIIKKLHTGPFRPYDYQQARTNLTPKQQAEVEPIVFDTFDSEFVIPDQTINAEIPTEDDAAIQEQAEPVLQTVYNINSDIDNPNFEINKQNRGSAEMNKLGMMEAAMAGVYGLGIADLAYSGMGNLGSSHSRRKMRRQREEEANKRRSELEKQGFSVDDARRRVSEEVNQQRRNRKNTLNNIIKKNKAIQVVHAVGLAAINPAKGTSELARAVGGKAGEKVDALAMPHRTIKKMVEKKNEKKRERPKNRVLREEAKDKSEVAKAALKAKDVIDKKSVNEEELKREIKQNMKINYKYDMIGPKKVQTPESITIKIPGEPRYGRITIPYGLFKKTPIKELYQVAVEYKIAQDAQKKLAAEKESIQASIASLNDEKKIREEEIKAAKDIEYEPKNPISRTTEEIAKDNAADAIRMMEKSGIPIKEETINAFANKYKQAWMEQQKNEISTLNTSMASMKMDLKETERDQKELANHIEKQGGIPEPPEPPPAHVPQEDKDIESPWSDFKFEFSGWF